MSKKEVVTMGAAEIAGVAGSGLASLAVMWNLMRALRAKGALSDIEARAILDAASGHFSKPSPGFEQMLFESARLTIGQMIADLRRAPAPPGTKH